jgi:molecular chaperone GrpE
MSDFAPPGVPANPSVAASERLTPEAIEAVLSDFRSWLLLSAAAPPSDGQPVAPSAPPDLHTLLGQLVALRQEVNLQTRATRTQQEQNAETLRHLALALDELTRAQEAARQKQDQSQDDVLRPLLKTLVDAYDALALAGREVKRIQEVLGPTLDDLITPTEPPDELPPPPSPPALSFWARWLGAGKAVEQALAAERQTRVVRPQREPAQRLAKVEQAVARIRQLLGSMLTGYTMSVQRIERALAQHGLEAITTVGEPFDPETMEAVEVVVEPGRETTTVIEEARRGYRWRGRVFRCAQVRVARPG